MNGVTAADAAALTDLVARYALYADERDIARLTGLFTPDGVLVLPDPPRALGPVLIRTGHEEIAAAMTALESLTTTFHALAGQVFDPGPEPGTATGAVACVAHHLSERADGPSDLVWHLRYADTYRRHDGAWRIARREVRIDWIETRPVRRVRGREGER
ncbi:nuclear transport factor 2 family protein [Microbispora sp. NEAU-D428]|uniref:nuclear transport factor 2 family protein n=1 Tax=Microbispora sitophila TaxID=2771537 RepID=UPI0018690D55|nr:nuclear transport factor 2 family protein [Microbispora sitophila]MBE3011814.1 nuclear transport factor 2 family protein [Microbispora sitophila]